MTIKELFQLAVENHASDLHLVVGLPPILRIDGALNEISGFSPITEAEGKRLVFSMLSETAQKRFTEERELDVPYELDDRTRFRINLHWEKQHVGMVARRIPSAVPTMEELNMPKVAFELLSHRQGLILVTGPTGCGKSTSLAAMINHINESRSEHIVTLEDPIEFVYEPAKSIIRQRQLGQDMNSFGEGLKHVLRQDPNVILVGEMRDLETIAATITLAETGHLVLATLHTYNAAQTVDRIIDVFPPHQQNQIRMQLSLFLRGVLSQQLLPSKKGGRVAAREIMINTPAVANLIRENKIPQLKTVIQTSSDEHMITMDQSLKNLVEQDLVEEATAVAYMMNPMEL